MAESACRPCFHASHYIRQSRINRGSAVSDNDRDLKKHCQEDQADLGTVSDSQHHDDNRHKDDLGNRIDQSEKGAQYCVCHRRSAHEDAQRDSTGKPQNRSQCDTPEAGRYVHPGLLFSQQTCQGGDGLGRCRKKIPVKSC